MSNEPKLLTWEVVPNHGRLPSSTILTAESMDSRYRFYIDTTEADTFELYRVTVTTFERLMELRHVGDLDDCLEAAAKIEAGLRQTRKEELGYE